jgi:hypothetical protein
MNTHSLENCISTLNKLRDAHCSQLDTSVLVELDGVIAGLQEVYDGAHSNADVGQLTMRTLQVIAVVLHIVTDVSDWLK